MVDKLILNQYHIKKSLEKNRKGFEDLVLNRNLVGDDSPKAIINKSGIYDKYSELEPKYNWNFGSSSFIGKKDFSSKKQNYKLFE